MLRTFELLVYLSEIQFLFLARNGHSWTFYFYDGLPEREEEIRPCLNWNIEKSPSILAGKISFQATSIGPVKCTVPLSVGRVITRAALCLSLTVWLWSRQMPDPRMNSRPIQPCKHYLHCYWDTRRLLYVFYNCKATVTKLSVFEGHILRLGPFYSYERQVLSKAVSINNVHPDRVVFYCCLCAMRRPRWGRLILPHGVVIFYLRRRRRRRRRRRPSPLQPQSSTRARRQLCSHARPPPTLG